jgi:hypothetical protein
MTSISDVHHPEIDDSPINTKLESETHRSLDIVFDTLAMSWHITKNRTYEDCQDGSILT